MEVVFIPWKSEAKAIQEDGTIILNILLKMDKQWFYETLDYIMENLKINFQVKKNADDVVSVYISSSGFGQS